MKHTQKNLHLTGELKYTGHKRTQTSIHLIQYSESYFNEIHTNDVQKINTLLHDKCSNWIRVSGMSDPELILKLVKDFGLNILDAKDILNPDHIITIEEFEENIFIVLSAVYYNRHKVLSTEHISLVLGDNYLISFQESEDPFYDHIYKTIKEKVVKIHTRSSDFLLATILNEIVEVYTNTLEELEDSLEGIEDKLLDPDYSDKNLLRKIQQKRRDIIYLRKVLTPYKDQFPKLLRADNKLVHEIEYPYYKDLYDQILYVIQNIESCREIMSSLLDLYMNRNDLKMNKIMKQLTVVATLFIPLTFFAGVWGMNFQYMPELQHPHGYLFAWIFMLCIAGIICWYFKKKGWF